MKKLILLLVTAIALGSVDGYSATPRRSGSRKSTTTASSKKSSAASPIAGLEKALASTSPAMPPHLPPLRKISHGPRISASSMPNRLPRPRNSPTANTAIRGIWNL